MDEEHSAYSNLHIGLANFFIDSEISENHALHFMLIFFPYRMQDQPPLLVQRCNGTTAGLGYLEVNVICPCKSPHWVMD